MLMVSLILVACAGVFNALMDNSAEGNLKNDKWNKDSSWMNKWSGYSTQHGWQERFPGSSTVFVWTTDFWHFTQFMYNNCWQVALAIHLPYPVVAFIVIKIIYSGIFELLYRYIKNK